MNYIDIILLIPIIWFAYRGFKRGFIIELASLIGLILGIYAALYFSGYAESFLRNMFDMSEKYAPMAAFITTFIAVVVVISLIGKILEKLVDMVALGFLNKMAGGVFGILKAVVLLSIIILIINFYNDKLISKEKREGSMLYNPVEAVAPFLWEQLEHFHFDKNDIDRLKDDVEDIEI